MYYNWSLTTSNYAHFLIGKQSMVRFGFNDEILFVNVNIPPLNNWYLNVWNHHAKIWSLLQKKTKKTKRGDSESRRVEREEISKLYKKATVDTNT